VAATKKFRPGIRAVVLILTATAFPVASLLGASFVAKAEVERRGRDGLAAIGKATVLQEVQAWDSAVRIVSSAASRPVPLSAVLSRDAGLATLGLQNILTTGPFADVRIYEPAGTLFATAALPGVTPSAVAGLGTPVAATTFGDPVAYGTGTSRQVAVPLGLGGRGRLVVDVDLAQLLGRSSDLAFGRTGAKFLVNRAGMVMAGSAAVGTPLQSAENRAIAAAGQPATGLIYSPFFKRLTVESYEPVPGQDMGILVQQARSEVMGGADHLAALLRWAAFVVALLGIALAGALGVVLGRRSRRLAESERRLVNSQEESRRRLERFLDAMPVGVFVVGPDGHPHYANREAERLLGTGIVPGAGPDDLADAYHAYVAGTDDLYPTEELPVVRALHGETSHVDDIEIRRSDATVPIEVWGTPVLAGDNSVEYGITVFGDIAERKQAQEAQSRLASLVQASREAILGKTLDGIVTSWNPGAEALFRYSAAEMIGRPIEVLIPAEGRDTEARLRARVACGLGVEQYESVRLRKDGTRVDVSITLSPIEGPDGRIAGIATICRDISERKRAEMALREREAQLAAARDQALEASRLKSQFLSNTSHEIRTPMTVINGMNELLQDTDLSPTQREFVEAASRAGASLMDIINDILDFSKIEAGRVDLEITDVAILPIVENAIILLSGAARAKGLDLSSTCPPDVPELVRGDASRLGQVLLNLVSNAVKFTDVGGVEVRASRRAGTAGPAVRIEVIDSGIGIAPENQRLLFQPFSQVDASSTRSYGGTGLGLAISAELVEAMGGTIGVSSSPEAGSTFWFEIPAEMSSSPART